VLDGIIINKDITHPKMRRRIENPRILLLDCPLEYKKGESQTNIEVTDQEHWNRILQIEEEQIKDLCEKIVAFKPDIVFTEKGVSGMSKSIVSAGILSDGDVNTGCVLSFVNSKKIWLSTTFSRPTSLLFAGSGKPTITVLHVPPGPPSSTELTKSGNLIWEPTVVFLMWTRSVTSMFTFCFLQKTYRLNTYALC
jgi:hypothetical protein